MIEGSCHCGNIRFTLSGGRDAGEIPARACDCSFCVKHGGLWTSDADGALEVTIAEPERVVKYAFGTGTADFHVCGRCGVAPVVTSEIEGRVYAVVSVNAFDDVDPARIRRAPISFEGEAREHRLARRKRNWIPNVQFVAATVGE